MSVDLTNLNLKPEVEGEIDYEHYQDQSQFPPPPPEGTYTFKAEFQDAAKHFDATGDGYLVAILKQTIVGGEHDGRQAASFDRVSTKTFDRNGTRAASFIDQLRAFGDKTPYRVNDYQALAEAIEACVDRGATWKGALGWEAYCSDCGAGLEPKERKSVTVKGSKNFPRLPNGQPGSVVECPRCGAELQARGRITRRIPA